MSEKTEKPTDKKIKDARKKGQVAQSQDVTKLFITAAILELVLAMVDSGMQDLETLVSVPLDLFNQPFAYAIEAALTRCMTIMVSMTAMVLGTAVIMKLAGSWAQFGFLFAPEALKLDFNKLNPMSQIKNMFSGKKLFELINNIFKAVAIATILYLFLEPTMKSLIKIPLTDLNTGWKAVSIVFIKVERACLATLLVLASIDFGMQKFFHLKSLKMSKDDIKQEYKNMEGDPHMKGHRKSLARELVEGDGPAPAKAKTNADMKEVDALVVNPTHYAVALHYRPGSTPLPMILHKGHDEDALELIALAKAENIPVIRFVWLARTLYKREEGQFIPRNTLRYVARIYQVIREFDEDVQHEDVLHIPDLETL